MVSKPTKWRLVFLFAALVVALAASGVLFITITVLLVVFAGILFGIFLNGISAFLARHSPMGYRLSYGVVVIVLFAAIIGGGYFMGWQIAHQASRLWSELQSVVNDLYSRIDSGWAGDHLLDADQLRDAVPSVETILPSVMTAGQWIVWGVTGIAVVFFVGLYVAYDPSLYVTGLVKLMAPERRDHAMVVLHKVRATLGRWIVGRIISMSIIGVLTAMGLWIMGVPLPVTLGVLAALLTFIPNIGPILAAVPQVLLALNVGTDTVLYVIVFNLVLQGVESYVVTPIVQRYEVTLPPALTITVQLVMTVLVGLVGIITAAPLTAAAMIIVQTVYIRDRLGDSHPGELTERTR